jgi:hypothetical protein
MALHIPPLLLIALIAVIAPLVVELPLGVRLPIVVVEMALGIVVGPHGLHLIAASIGKIKPLFTRAHPPASPRTSPVSPRGASGTPWRTHQREGGWGHGVGGRGRWKRPFEFPILGSEHSQGGVI